MYSPFFEAAATWQRVAMAQMQMMYTASTVIQIRVMQMGLGIMRPDEAARMVLEKPTAFAKSTEMSMRALARNPGLCSRRVGGDETCRRQDEVERAQAGRHHHTAADQQDPAAEIARVADGLQPENRPGPGP